MKKTMIAPRMEVIRLQATDIIVTSIGVGDPADEEFVMQTPTRSIFDN